MTTAISTPPAQPHANAPTMVDSALAYAALGWFVLPVHSMNGGVCTCGRADCNTPGKHPRTAHGLKDASTDANQIRTWWSRWLNANIAVRTGPESGFLAIDLDRYKESYADGLEQLEAKLGKLPETAQGITGGGGEHLLFRFPDGAYIRSRDNIEAAVDVRGNNGYILVSPSLHKSGRRYEWEIEHNPSDGYPLAELPTTWVRFLSSSVPKEKGNPKDNGRATKVNELDRKKAVECLGKLKFERANDYESWLRVGMALHSVDARDDMLAVWDKWSRQSEKYKPGVCREKWATFAQDGIEAPAEWKELGIKRRTVTLATLIAWAKEDDPRDESCPYRTTPTGLVWDKATKDGSVPVPLTNFTAKIVADVVHDDGQEQTHNFEIEARLCNGKHPARRFVVPANRFAGLTWVPDQLGARAVVYPGFTIRDHARTAIQLLSDTMTARTVFTHTGWRKLPEHGWCYLHCNGAIGSNGVVGDVEVDLHGTLDRFALPEPATGDALTETVRAELELLDLGPDEMMVSVLGAVLRSVLGPADFSLALVGPTGVFKSELAAIAQQHFGLGFDARHLPGSWSSTGNALERLAFDSKDAILVVDDFAPAGTTFDIARFHKEADRVLRAQGNRSGRSRLRADGELRPVRSPRGLILITGEDVPRGSSLRARLLILELTENDITSARLHGAQRRALDGTYARAMSGYLRWLAGRYEKVRSGLVAAVARLRQEATRSGQHRRTPDIIANLAAGWNTFAQFAVEIGALSEEEWTALRKRVWIALGAAGEQQRAHMLAADPARKFIDLLGAAITCGEAHVADIKGYEPDTDDHPLRWGWRLVACGREQSEWRPQGRLVGWVSGDDLYLDPTAAFRAVQAMAGPSDSIGVSEQTLRKRLKEARLLITVDEGRDKVLVRRTLQGRRRNVLHFRTDVLGDGTRCETGQNAGQAPQNQDDGPVLWAGYEESFVTSAHKPPPSRPQEGRFGPVGPVGPVSETQDPKVIEPSDPEVVGVSQNRDERGEL